MSGLEKFQANEAWRTNFKKFLFMERKPELLQQTVTINETQRYSLDIGEDLKNILEQKKNQKVVKFNLQEPKIKNQNITTKDIGHKQKEITTTMNRPVVNFDDTTHGNQETSEYSLWQKTSDESFEALEKMCDKTASDPNSTLFHYLHSDRKEQVLADVKKRSADGNMIHANERDPLLIKLGNCTILDDVEEPSRMWENTICCETIQTSPVKMVGLLRPSTIIEEAPDNSSTSDISSQTSFQTATKGVPSDVSSSTYSTAHDSTIASTGTDFSNKPEFSLEEIDVDHILISAFEKSEANQLEVIEVNTCDSATTSDEYTIDNKSAVNDESMNLIDFEKTFIPLDNSPHSSILEDTVEEINDELEGNESELESYNVLDDSVIEILSDEDEIGNKKEEEEEVKQKQQQHENYQMLYDEIKPEDNSKTSNINHDTYSFEESYNENKENCGEVNDPSDKSMQFNDTMEEVEYMLKKYAEGSAAKPISLLDKPTNSLSEIKVSNTQQNSPVIKKNPISHVTSSASKVKSSNYTTPAKKTPSSKCGDPFEMRPFPKVDFFAKPTHARHKELAASKQQKFSHIISPIGAYMKKTATTPLMASMRNKNKNSDVLNSTAFRELENESRLYQPKFETHLNSAEVSGLSYFASGQKTLPKKAYISSELKHIVDERTPITIPGGKKIQKYLENAMMPAILRHEGKFKIPGGINNKFDASPSSSSATYPSKLPLKTSNTNSTTASGGTTSSQIPRRNNSSLADLSLMSGDVSMYTIMDAQKF